MAQDDCIAGAVQTVVVNVITGGTLTPQTISAELETVSNWHALGVKLGVPGHELSKIEQTYPHDSTHCKHEMAQKWLNSARNCSWQALSNALHEIGNHAVADRITNRYLTSQQVLLSESPLSSAMTSSPPPPHNSCIPPAVVPPNLQPTTASRQLTVAVTLNPSTPVKAGPEAKLGKHKKNDHEEGPRPKVSRRCWKCGVCDGCKRSEDCGDCINCKDNPKRGGPGTRKKPCKLRQCNDLQDAPPREKKEKTSQAKPPAVLVGIWNPPTPVKIGPEAKLGKHTKKDHEEPRPKVSRRRWRCGVCDGCKRSEDCGDCINCKDNPKRGGPGTRKKTCKFRQCNDLQDAPPREKKEKTSQAKPSAVLGEATDGQWQLQQQQQQQHQQLQHQEAMEKNDRAISTLQTASEQQRRALQHELSILNQKHQEELEKKKEEILHLSATMTHQSTQLQSQLKQLQIEIQERDKRNSELHQRLDQTLQQLKEKETIALSLQNAAALQRQTLEQKTHEIANLKQKNQREMQQKDKELTQLTSKSKLQLSQLEAQTHQLSKLQKQVQEKQTEISKLTNTINNQLRKIENLDFQISVVRSEMQQQERQATEWKCWEGDVKGALESLSSVVYRRRQIKKEDSS